MAFIFFMNALMKLAGEVSMPKGAGDDLWAAGTEEVWVKEVILIM